MIRAEGLELTYKDGTRALEEIGLVLEPGELVYITGPSGSGKTSLLKLLMGMEFATGGSLEVLGERMRRGNSGRIRKMRRQLGPVFQEFRLIPGSTAMENVLLGLRFDGTPHGKMKEYAEEALLRVGLSQKLHAKVERLSWGERQRVAIARAVARKPRLILADEPTGNLDRENALLILELLASFRNPETTVLITTHATHLIEGQETASILHLDGGRMRLERPVSL
ncbi:cell division ATP-binding protein FtsE [Anaerotalea alkaliphila]|uniref:ATP-binding cassette domain-containing protein n=1 Tax=Anaerotalea alkaliphila TaxID=2662126 RepID=A0A7X5KMW5_9FIRM|nr:ATP-binding cassette domain-containing protein [Anaerotalea alkaliphila]NDL68254.1 ATP-binding cassette domain-containing protein [Anaerotalea alkaliphila]